jgi:pyridoxine kinase
MSIPRSERRLVIGKIRWKQDCHFCSSGAGIRRLGDQHGQLQQVNLPRTIHLTAPGNHTGYGHVTGTKTSAETISELYRGLAQLELNDFSIMISGYLPGPEAINAVGKIAAELAQRGAAGGGPFFWVLDPVMGDSGRFYLPEAAAPAYRALLPRCSLLLPNQFELEQLVGTPVQSIRDLTRAIARLHREHGVPHVVVTSTDLSPPADAARDFAKRASAAEEKAAADAAAGLPPPAARPDGSLTVFGSTVHRPDGAARIFCVVAPRYPARFTGCGDLFAALVTAFLRDRTTATRDYEHPHWLQPLADGAEPRDEKPCMMHLAWATRRAVAGMQGVLRATLARVVEAEEALRGAEGAGEAEQAWRRTRRMEALELRVIETAAEWMNPRDLDRITISDVKVLLD